jgi:DNA-binding transcriptional MerR regulator
MKIGDAAREAGVTVKAIRHYESVGLLGEVERAGSYRDFSATDLERLRLIAHCRELGFSLREIAQVAHLVAEAKPSCPQPKAMIRLVERRLRAIDEELIRLQEVSAQLGNTRAYLQRRLEEQGP